jgi:ribosomal-protein-alanine N-acetyltransferase
MAQPIPSQILETARTLLRPLSLEDSEAMYEVYSDPETMKYWSSQPVNSIEGARKLVQADVDWVKQGSAVLWAIAEPSSNKALGKCVLFQFSKENQRAELGYVLNREHWGIGLMTEVMTKVIDFAFDELGLHRLEADTDTLNAGSLALLGKLGFQQEGMFRHRWKVYGEWQDSAMLGLLKPDWEASGLSGNKADQVRDPG